MIGNHPEVTSLYLAVLDGPDPATWPLYGGDFSKVMSDACEVACREPCGVPPQYLESFSVGLEAILAGPEKLLQEQQLDNVVGVIVDALPKTGMAQDFKKKLDDLEKHVRAVKLRNKNRPDPMFLHFGYKIWFVTENARLVSDFVKEAVRTAERMFAGRMFKEPVRVDWDFVFSERGLADNLSVYLAK